MKKIAFIFTLMFGIVSLGFSQKTTEKVKDPKEVKKTTTATTKTPTIAVMNTDPSPKKGVKSDGKNNDGSPDMRLKVNKEAEAKRKADEKAKSTTATTSTDKVVGKDASGRTLYEGSKGGKYYMNKSGNKEYISKPK